MSFLSAIISLTNSCCSFSLDFLCLVGVASVAIFSVGSITPFGVGSAAGSASFSALSCVGNSSKTIIGNNLILKLKITFSLAVNNNPQLFF